MDVFHVYCVIQWLKMDMKDRRSVAERVADGLMRCVESLVSVVKLLGSRGCDWVCGRGGRGRCGGELVVLGNGPSLRGLLDGGRGGLRGRDLLAVNFAGRTVEFFDLRPGLYVLADPVFFGGTDDGNVLGLREALGRVDWDMRLFVPWGVDASAYEGNGCVRVERFNFLAVEGWGWLERWAWGSGRGMPRPRNVLIPSLMIGLWLGYDVVYVAGADHSWMRTLEVDEGNRVVSVQPHFYADNEEEGRRVAEVYSGVRLHEVVYSFYLAFKGYHAIRRLADRMGIRVVNVTAGSFIDAFERGRL